MLRVICVLLLLWGMTVALDELEVDAQVAPPPTEVHKPFEGLWQGFVGRFREVLHQWGTTKAPRLQLRSTTPEAEEPDYDAPAGLQYYGALNPIYQTLNF